METWVWLSTPPGNKRLFTTHSGSHACPSIIHIMAMFNLFGKKNKEKEKLFFATDIHCHVVPGIDDGSPDAQTSVELIGRMKNWGINRILATPHVTQDTFENTPETIAPALTKLRSALSEAGVEIDIANSAEYRLDEFSLAQIDGGKAMPYPGNYLLVENSFIQEPWNLQKIIFDLIVAGYRPIWAHPERYQYYYPKDKRSRYDDMHSYGAMFQINLLSLAGFYGKDEKKVAEYLIEKGYVDFVGTDLHNHRHADAIEAYIGSRDFRRHRDMLAGRLRNDTAFAQPD